MDNRTKLLQELPEARKRIDSAQLKQIIDYQDFKCHPQSSIARDQAIAGSDIDGAVVVLKNDTPAEQQVAFVEELRAQGFSAFHPTEVQKRQEEVNEAIAKGVPASSDEIGELIRKANEAENAQIRFYTTTQLEEMKKQPLDSPTIIYVAGYSMK